MNNTLPPNWKYVKVGEIATLLRGISYKKEQSSNSQLKNYLPILRANNINGELNFDDLVFVPSSIIEDEQLIKKGDIIFAMSSGSKYLVGKSAIAKKDINASYGAFCGLLRKKSEEVSSTFLGYYFKGNKYRKLISEIAKGTNINNLKREHILDLEIPLPSLPTQSLIVSKIEELFSELDKGIEQLRTAQAQLKTYRQAVLKHAFEGKLTNENVKEGELPEGWKWVKLGEICNIIGGVTKGRDFKGKKTIHLPYLRVANVQDGYLDLKEIKNIEVLPTDKEKYKLEYGDILYTEGGDKDKLGRGTIWKNEIENCIHQNHIFRARPMSDQINSKYIAYFSQTKYAKNYFFKYGKQTTNLASINLTILSNLPITLCPIETQHLIVQAIESRLSVADKLEESIRQSLQQAEALRQSILKKAFEGRLVQSETVTARQQQIAKVVPFERKVLAGKIIHLLNDDKYFGLTKFQKVLYVVENYAEVEYKTNFLRERAGPYDRDFTLAFRKEMQEKDWFAEETKLSQTRFVPGENVGSLIKEYAKYFRNKGAKIVFAMQQLKDKSTHEAELIATLYAVWNNRLIKKQAIKEKELINDFFCWSEKKKEEFQEDEVSGMFKWMKKMKLTPKGFGKLIC